MPAQEGGAERSKEKKERIRISVANLVSTVRIEETGEVFSIAIQGPRPFRLPDGREVPRYQALGGGVKVSETLIQQLVNTHGAEFGAPGQPDEERNDARFVLPAASSSDVASILEIFSAEHADAFEDGIERELREELVECGLSEDDVANMHTQFVGAVSPVSYSIDITHRAQANTIPRRLFRLHELQVSQALFEKLKAAEGVRILSESDLEALARATTERNPAALLPDEDAVIIENVALDLPHLRQG